MFIDVTQEFTLPALHGRLQFALISSERHQEAAPVIGANAPTAVVGWVESCALVFLRGHHELNRSLEDILKKVAAPACGPNLQFGITRYP